MKPLFSIESWVLWCDDNVFSHDSNQKSVQFEQLIKALNYIPHLKRRRMSNLTKMALSTSELCLRKFSSYNSHLQPSSVFCSQHGELTRTVNILFKLATGEELSPAEFSLSVHNTALGLYSILNNNKECGTTVAAGGDTLGFGLIEALHRLYREPQRPILITCFDEPLPYPLEQYDFKAKGAYSFSMIIAPFTNHGFNISYSKNESKKQSNREQILSLAHYLSSGNKSENITGERFSWEWQRCI